MENTICVIGAGTMGSGIAQTAAQSGFSTVLFDISNDMLQKAATGIQSGLQYLVQKQKISAAGSDAIFKRLHFTSNMEECVADIFIEAIVENTAAKVKLFSWLSQLNPAHTIFASNTSSLSITGIQKELPNPERVVGMHFFNPAPVMKLVEVVKGELTADSSVQKIYALCKKMNKVPVICKDAPGFIVNRVARHYYLEAMKLVEAGVAGFENVDAILEATGFKMGPFKLMDLIGMDINLAVSQSLYEASGREERFKPAGIQVNKVKDGELGRKTGKGFYRYN